LKTVLVDICFIVVQICVCTDWIISFECCTAVINEEWQGFLHVCLLDYIKSILSPQNITLIAIETAVGIEGIIFVQ
jgi:hypothetical protein